MPDQTPTVGMTRKLVAIFNTDVAGYSRLMGEEKEATRRTLTAYRKDGVDSSDAIATQRGEQVR